MTDSEETARRKSDSWQQRATFRFYEELNDFLPPDRRAGPYAILTGIRLWPKADTRGRIFRSKFDHRAVFGPLSVR